MTNKHGAEYRTARAINLCSVTRNGDGSRARSRKPMTSCEQSGNRPTITLPAPANRSPEARGRFRSSPISSLPLRLLPHRSERRPPQAGDRLAQRYFAVQTRRQELTDAQAADQERLELRRQASEEFKNLSGRPGKPV